MISWADVALLPTSGSFLEYVFMALEGVTFFAPGVPEPGTFLGEVSLQLTPVSFFEYVLETFEGLSFCAGVAIPGPSLGDVSLLTRPSFFEYVFETLDRTVVFPFGVFRNSSGLLISAHGSYPSAPPVLSAPSPPSGVGPNGPPSDPASRAAAFCLARYADWKNPGSTEPAPPLSADLALDDGSVLRGLGTGLKSSSSSESAMTFPARMLYGGVPLNTVLASLSSGGVGMSAVRDVATGEVVGCVAGA